MGLGRTCRPSPRPRDSDPLDDDVVRNYWIGGPLLDKVDPAELLTRLREVFTGQVTGILDDITADNALAHHSFHVFAVYPWVGFLDRDPSTPLRVMQACRIRWGTVESVDDDHAVITSAPLTFDDGALGLGDAAQERVRWRKDDTSLAPAPVPGSIVAAHWDWVCGTMTDAECRCAGRCDETHAGTGELALAARPAHHWSRGTSKSAQSARHTSRGSTPSSMA